MEAVEPVEPGSVWAVELPGAARPFLRDRYEEGDEHWTDHAACRGADPEIFYPIGYGAPALEMETAAKAVCGRCPVQTECLGWALRVGEPDGIWGGTNPDERRALRRRRRSAARVA